MQVKTMVVTNKYMAIYGSQRDFDLSSNVSFNLLPIYNANTRDREWTHRDSYTVVQVNGRYINLHISRCKPERHGFESPFILSDVHFKFKEGRTKGI